MIAVSGLRRRGGCKPPGGIRKLSDNGSSKHRCYPDANDVGGNKTNEDVYTECLRVEVENRSDKTRSFSWL